MVSLATSILLIVFVQAVNGSTSTTPPKGTTTPPTTTNSQGITTTSQGTTTPPATTTSQGITTTSQGTVTPPATTTTQGITTTSQGTTTPPATTTSKDITTLPTSTTSQGTTTPSTTTTSQGITTLPTSTTSQGTTTTPTTTTSQGTTTPQTTTTSQGTTTTPTTTTSQGTTTTPTTTTLRGTTTLPTTTISQGTTTTPTTTTSRSITTVPTTTTSQDITTLPTSTTSQGTTTAHTSTTSQTTTASRGITTPQTTTTSDIVTTPQTTTTSQGSQTPQIATTLHGTATSHEVNATSQDTATSQSALTYPGTTSTRSPVLTPSKEPVAYEPDPGYYDLRLQLDLKLYLDFKDIYGDRTSPDFQSLSTNISVSLIAYFRYIKGFKSIEILQFRPGSVIVDYTVNVYGTVDILAVTNQIENEVVDILKEVAGTPVDIGYTRTSMKSRLGSLRTRDRCSLASANLCPFGYYCKQGDTTTLLCIDRCNVSVCENNGLCYIGHLSQDVQCKCPISDGAVFTGDRCQTKQVVMTIQERNLYLIIAGSIFGAFIFSFVLTVCIINRKRRILKKRFSINLRMKQDQPHKAGVKYIRDEHNRYADSNETAFNRQRQNIFDTTDNPYQEGKANAVDDGYLQAVQDVREDDGYLRAAEGIRRKDDSVYDYIK